MKVYEKPLVDISTFDVEDVLTESGYYAESNELFQQIDGGAARQGVVFEW